MNRALALSLLLIASLLAAHGAGITPPPLPGAAGTNVVPPIPPLPPRNVNWFRELLAKPAAERALALADFSEARRELFLRKLREYDALPPEERELKLRTTELRVCLSPLLHTPREQRAALLAPLAPEERRLIEERLTQWDLLPPDLQTPLLENQTALDYFARVEGQTPAQQQSYLDGLSPVDRQRVEASLARWKQLPAAEQQRITQQSAAFFQFTEHEKQVVLAQMPAGQREQLQRTMAAVQDLPTEQREACLTALRQYAGMSPEQRQRFLTAVGRWEAMTAADRAHWRSLSSKLPPLPPLPPGLVPQFPPITSSR
ncbi:MAG: DUF3106 domain-containing protein [Verrucomicrobia bacterium]|nr:DUF3106 domain-containing protein [Verrucomicrobiota bacterium]